MKVLLLGANGNVGSGFISEYLRRDYKKYYELILGVRDKKFKDKRFKVRRVSLDDKRGLGRVFAGIDVVVNLAANPLPSASFNQLIVPNIIGSYNVFHVAMKKKIKRVVFASSIHAVYDNLGERVNSRVFPKPSDLYGASKVFGESLCYVFSRKNMSCFAIRIGAYTSNERLKNVCYSRKDYEHVISERDMGQLIHKAIIAPMKIKFGIFNGVSKNKKMDMELKETRKVLGYKPEDDMYKLCKELRK